jgi:hypothetical protein
MILLHVPKVLVQILVSVCICLARGFVDSRVVLQLWNRRGVGRDNWTNQTRNPNIPTVKRWSRPTVAPTNQMDPEIPLSQAEEEKSPARVRKTLNAAFDPSEKLIRSCSLF